MLGAALVCEARAEHVDSIESFAIAILAPLSPIGDILVLKTILVALDSSEHSQRVIQSLDELQIQRATKIILCHVISAPESDAEMAVDRPHTSEELFY